MADQLKDLVLPGTDGSPLEAIDEGPLEVDESNNFLPEGDLPDLPDEQVEDTSTKELEDLRRKVELYERERKTPRSQNMQETLAEFGFDKLAIPLEHQQQLSQASQSYLGQSLEETLYLVAKGKKAVIEEQVNDLRKEWKEDFDEVYAAVREEYRMLPQAEKVYYNNTRGALLLGNKYLLDKERSRRAATPSVPRVESSQPLRAAGANASQFSKATTYTWAYIDACVDAPGGNEWYVRNADKITRLAELGLIK